MYISKAYYYFLQFFALVGIVDGLFFLYLLSQINRMKNRGDKDESNE